MDRKQLATVAVVCGVVAFVAVLMPWYSVSVSGMPGGGAQSQSANGTEGDFSGTFVIILSLLAGAAALLVVLGKTDVVPLDERQHLFAALGLFALAALVTLTDVFRDLPSMSEGMGGVKMEAGKGFGLYLTLIATLAGAAASFLAVQKPSMAPPAGPAADADE